MNNWKVKNYFQHDGFGKLHSRQRQRSFRSPEKGHNAREHKQGLIGSIAASQIFSSVPFKKLDSSRGSPNGFGIRLMDDFDLDFTMSSFFQRLVQIVLRDSNSS